MFQDVQAKLEFLPVCIPLKIHVRNTLHLDSFNMRATSRYADKIECVGELSPQST